MPRRRRTGLTAAVAILAAAAVLVAALTGWGLRVYAVDSASMSPTLRQGDRLLVVPARDLRRGDVVVLDASGTWVAEGSPDPVFVKRVVGLPGERVVCCDPQGRITVDGAPLDESAWTAPGAPASGRPFDVAVPAGRLWLLGDDRDTSRDSRDHLGSPGGGTVSVERVLGRVAVVLWPPQRADTVPRPSAR